MSDHPGPPWSFDRSERRFAAITFVLVLIAYLSVGALVGYFSGYERGLEEGRAICSSDTKR